MAKVLLIDDDESLLTVFATALKKEGLEITTASNGKDGLSKAKEGAPNLILLDEILPDISGNEVLKSLKNEDQTKNIPILILSNFSQENLVKEAIQEGAIDYIFKYQVEPSDVVKKVKGVLKI